MVVHSWCSADMHVLSYAMLFRRCYGLAHNLVKVTNLHVYATLVLMWRFADMYLPVLLMACNAVHMLLLSTIWKNLHVDATLALMWTKADVLVLTCMCISSTQFGKGLQTCMYTQRKLMWRSAYMHVLVRILINAYMHLHIHGWDSLSFWFAQFGKGQQHM